MARTARTRAVLDHPSKVLAAFLTAGAAVAASVNFTGHWTHVDRVILVACVVLCLTGGCVYFFAGQRLQHWTLHVGAVLGAALITVGTAIGPANGVNPAVVYIWVLVYAALYFAPKVTVAYTAAVGAAYAMVLGVGPPVDNPAAAWLTVMGSGTVAAVIILGLVGLLRSDAREDCLTGLANRRSWNERLDEEVERARRAGTALSVAIIDLDDFKVLNDTSGHEVGDHLLRTLSAAWQGVVRGGAGDFLARLGGDEFGLLAPGSDATGIRRLAKRLAEATAEGIAYSIGVATWDGKEPAGDLLHRADQSMYRKKLVKHGARQAPC